MTKIKIEGGEYFATVTGSLRDSSWEDRDTKTIEFYGILSAAEVAELFHEECEWSIICENEVINPETGETETVREEYDNSEYSVAGAVTDYRDGIVSVKMAKLSEVEMLLCELFG